MGKTNNILGGKYFPPFVSKCNPLIFKYDLVEHKIIGTYIEVANQPPSRTSSAPSTMARGKLGGVGAVGSAFLRYVHPSDKLKERYGAERVRRERRDGWVIKARSVGRTSRRGNPTPRYHLSHPDFPADQEFLVSTKFFKVTREGEVPFAEEVRHPVAAAAPTATAVDREASTIAGDDPALVRMAGRAARGRGGVRGLPADDVGELRAQGITVDLDTEPAPENAGPPPPVAAGAWINQTVCPRLHA